MKRTLCILLSLMLAVTSFAGLCMSASAAYNVGDIIKFGSYPQSEVKDSSLIDSLNVQSNIQSKKWRFYPYYSGAGEESPGNSKVSDFMEYIDINYGGQDYRGVRFSAYRPSWIDGTHSANDSCQDDNGYFTGTTYWFLWEPLQWRILDPNSGLVLCETIIDCQPFNNYRFSDDSPDINNNPYVAWWGDSSKTYYANNYAKSPIRVWLMNETDNSSFLNTAFTPAQRDVILNTTLDNSASNTSCSAYDGASTTDKIFLLSWRDIQNKAYGLDGVDSNGDSKSQAQSSDYAKCQGLAPFFPSVSFQCPSWWLRTPGITSFCACYVSQTGIAYNFDRTGTIFDSYGIRPAMRLKSVAPNAIDDVSDVSYLDEDAYIKKVEAFQILHDLMLNQYVESLDIFADCTRNSVAKKYYQFLHFDFTTDYYELVLMDWLLDQENYNNQESDFTIKQLSNLSDYVSEFLDAAANKNILDDNVEPNAIVNLLSAPDISDYQNSTAYNAIKTILGTLLDSEDDPVTVSETAEFLTDITFAEMEKFSEVMNFVSAGVDIVEQFHDLLHFMAAVNAYNDQSQERKEVFRIAAENTDSEDVRKALNTFIEAEKSHFSKFVSFYKEALFKWGSISATVLKTIYEDQVLSFARAQLAKLLPNVYPKLADIAGSSIASGIVIGVNIGLMISRLMTDELNEDMSKGIALYDISESMHRATKYLSNQFKSNRTYENAVLYSAAMQITGELTSNGAAEFLDYYMTIDQSVVGKIADAVSKKGYNCDYQTSVLSRVRDNALNIASAYRNYDKSRPKGSPAPDDSFQEVYYCGVAVACPVNVRIMDAAGKTVCDVTNNEVVSCREDCVAFVLGEEKYFSLPQDETFSFRVTGYDSGTMSVTITELDSEGIRTQTQYLDVPVQTTDSFTFTEEAGFKESDVSLKITRNGTDTIRPDSFVVTNNSYLIKATLKVPMSAKVGYKSTVTVTATAEGVPEGYFVALYDGDTQLAKGDNKTVSYTMTKMKAGKTLTAKVIDLNGNVQSNADGKLEKEIKITVKTGFFDKVKAFFLGLFGLLPKVELKP